MIYGVFTPISTTADHIQGEVTISGSAGAPTLIRRIREDRNTVTFQDVHRGKLFRFRKDQQVTVLVQEDWNDPVIQAELICGLADKGVEY